MSVRIILYNLVCRINSGETSVRTGLHSSPCDLHEPLGPGPWTYQVTGGMETIKPDWRTWDEMALNLPTLQSRQTTTITKQQTPPNNTLLWGNLLKKIQNKYRLFTNVWLFTMFYYKATLSVLCGFTHHVPDKFLLYCDYSRQLYIVNQKGFSK